MISVFSKQWFKKYNRVITRVARLPILGEWIFHFKKFGHYVDRKKIVEVTPNSVIEFIGYKKGKVELKQHFFVRNEYALRLQSVFYPIWITFHIWDIITKPIPQLNLGFDTLTVYPDKYGGGTAVDGELYSGISSWANVRGASSTATYSGSVTNSPQWYSYVGSTFNGSAYSIYRAVTNFDTDALTAEATISGAVYSIMGSTDSDTNDGKICIVAFTGNASTLVATDYNDFGTTDFATRLDIGSYSLTSYNDFTLNASGISNISKTGISKFGVRDSNDVDNSTPSSYTLIGVGTERYSAKKSKLVITYTTSTAYTAEVTEALAMVSSDTQVQALLSTIINNLALNETQTDNSQFNQSAIDNLSLSDTNTNQIDRGAIVNDNLGLSETESNETKFNQAFSETLANEETTTGSIAFISNIEETIKGTESIGIITQFLSSVSDALAIIQELWGDWWTELSKHTTSWTQSSKNTTSYTQQSKNTTSWTQETKNKTNTKLG
jgi:hypothetical protein